MKKPVKIGLALGGGGAKGLAHIGVIKALEVAQIPIDFIVGTSMGALVGGWYALTRDIAALEDLFLKMKFRDIFPIHEVLKTKKDGALFHGDTVEKLLNSYFGKALIENSKIPFSAVATDLQNGDEIVIHEGSLAAAIRASIALPIIFRPAPLKNKLLIDGGFSNPVPADVARNMGANFVIAVDVSSRWIKSPEDALDAKSVYSVITNSLSVVEYQLAKGILKNADIVLRPPVLTYGWLEFGRGKELIDIGRDEVNLRLTEIRKKSGIDEPPKTFGQKFLDFLFKGGENW